MNIVNSIRQQVSLAETHAEDGALHSAARVLRDLADEVQTCADQADAFLSAMIDREEAKGGA